MVQAQNTRTTRSGAGARVVLIVLAVVAALLVVGCLACGGLTFFGFTTMVDQGIKQQYNGHPVITQHIGEIETAAMNVTASQAVQQEFGSDDYAVFDLSGSKGEGQLILHQPQGDTFQSGDAVLRTANGDFKLGPLEEAPQAVPSEPASPDSPNGNEPEGASETSEDRDFSDSRYPEPAATEIDRSQAPAFPEPTD